MAQHKHTPSAAKMKISKHNIIAASALLLTLLIPSEEAAIGISLLRKETVVIRNDIPGEDVTTIRCYSSDDDLGVQTLSYASNFTWHFHMNLARSTKFYCDFTSTLGSGNYGVFTRRLQNMCDDYCLWLIKATGPCLQQTVFNGQYCQSWKTTLPFPPPTRGFLTQRPRWRIKQ